MPQVPSNDTVETWSKALARIGFPVVFATALLAAGLWGAREYGRHAAARETRRAEADQARIARLEARDEEKHAAICQFLKSDAAVTRDALANNTAALTTFGRHVEQLSATVAKLDEEIERLNESWKQ